MNQVPNTETGKLGQVKYDWKSPVNHLNHWCEKLRDRSEHGIYPICMTKDIRSLFCSNPFKAFDIGYTKRHMNFIDTSQSITARGVWSTMYMRVQVHVCTYQQIDTRYSCKCVRRYVQRASNAFDYCTAVKRRRYIDTMRWNFKPPIGKITDTAVQQVLWSGYQLYYFLGLYSSY